MNNENDVIAFYDQTTDWFEFSNFYRHEIEINDEVWPTVEHYYQAMKFCGQEYYHLIKAAPNPREAKRLGKCNPNIVTDWEEYKEAIMYQALLAKFSDAILAEKLLSTGELRIEEHSHEDAYWGTGRDGSGKNRMGEILMIVRDDLNKEKQSKHTQWIKNCEITPEELAESMGDLFYDSLADYLRLLSQKIKHDGSKDQQRGRVKLALALDNASYHLRQASDEIDKAWEICKPYLDNYPIDEK